MCLSQYRQECKHNNRGDIVKRADGNAIASPLATLRKRLVQSKAKTAELIDNSCFFAILEKYENMGKDKSTTTIAEMQELARRKGGLCLSPAFISHTTKLLWECASGHRWEALPHNIKIGTWCPVCAKQKQRFWNHQMPQNK